MNNRTLRTVARLLSRAHRAPHGPPHVQRAHARLNGDLATSAAVAAGPAVNGLLFSHGSAADLVVCGGASLHMAGTTVIAPAGYGGFASATCERVLFRSPPPIVCRLLPRMLWAVRLLQFTVTLLCTPAPRLVAPAQPSACGFTGNNSGRPSPTALGS
ncbi:hypothetical protein [Nonomuraea turkmeniaca]|uniref:hypothetical protein n=1 Tax=Nonomuraea turkmeniaca TaxID=103838 RepID=UPI0014777A12|nr:hypothetical protein [Nonomuraea turkmeniaca]